MILEYTFLRTNIKIIEVTEHILKRKQNHKIIYC